jgi:ribosomal-protein-alanine N-acetyltransferase
MNLEKLFEKYPVIIGAGIKLKQILEKDLDNLFAIYNNDKVFQYCGILPKHNKKTVGNMIGHFERDFNKKSRVKFGIYKDDQMLGIIECFDFKKKINMVTIGYYIAEEHWNKGYSTKALKLLSNYLINEIEINRIQAEVMTENIISKKVLLKNGFEKEGTIRQGAFWPGKGIVDYDIYSKLANNNIE